MSGYEAGQVVRMKKSHPCGGFEWEIQRVGMDFRIRCVTCGRSVMLTRAKFENAVKKGGPPARGGECKR